MLLRIAFIACHSTFCAISNATWINDYNFLYAMNEVFFEVLIANCHKLNTCFTLLSLIKVSNIYFILYCCAIWLFEITFSKYDFIIFKMWQLTKLSQVNQVPFYLLIFFRIKLLLSIVKKFNKQLLQYFKYFIGYLAVTSKAPR